MNLVALVIILGLIGSGLYLVNLVRPIDLKMRKIIAAVITATVLLWLLNFCAPNLLHIGVTQLP